MDLATTPPAECPTSTTLSNLPLQFRARTWSMEWMRKEACRERVEEWSMELSWSKDRV
jgi:hypothetical protein